jgi:serine/threonine protein kinase
VYVDQMILPVGATIKDSYGDHYRIEALLGKGRFGAVYLAKNRQKPDSIFALKEVIDPNSRDRERLLSECEILKRLDHRALPHVYHAFANTNLRRIYLLMDYVGGKNLEELLRKQPERRFPLDLALAMLTPIVDALIYMHSQVPYIIHRDIKPANIIMPLDGGEAVLVDFGTAKEYVGDASKGFSQASPGFAAIEQYGASGGTDLRTDVYGLAATLYTLVTGVTPVDSVSRLINDQGIDPLKPVNLLVPSFSPIASDIIVRGLSIKKSDRFASVEEFWQALRLASEKGVVAERAPSVKQQKRVAPINVNIANDNATRIMASAVEPSRRFMIPGRWRPLLMILALCVIILGAGVAFLSTAHFFVRTTTAARPYSSTSVASMPTSASTNPASGALYPILATSYAGTISDINIAQEKTTMTLTDVHINQGNITGIFKGLGLAGHFSGTLSPAGAMQFSVPIQQGASTLAFTGTIKVGGDLAGDFYVLNKTGQRTGEFGIWNVGATS